MGTGNLHLLLQPMGEPINDWNVQCVLFTMVCPNFTNDFHFALQRWVVSRRRTRSAALTKLNTWIRWTRECHLAKTPFLHWTIKTTRLPREASPVSNHRVGRGSNREEDGLPPTNYPSPSDRLHLHPPCPLPPTTTPPPHNWSFLHWSPTCTQEEPLRVFYLTRVLSCCHVPRGLLFLFILTGWPVS